MVVCLIEYMCTGLDITDLKSKEERPDHFHTHFEEKFPHYSKDWIQGEL